VRPPPNTALQLTASRARSFVFDVILCGALAATECHTVRQAGEERGHQKSLDCAS